MIEKILAWLNAIPPDKVMHFASGVVLFAAATPFIGARYAMAAVTIIAFLKEIYDAFNRDAHTPDVFDALATICGGCVGLFIKGAA